MATTCTTRPEQSSFTNQILHGDCIEVMRAMPANSVDFILTDPPYLVNFRDRTGRTLQNDTDADWLRPAMREAYRVLKSNRLMLCFYGWPRAEKFLEAWREAGFRPVGHLVFRKSYTAKATDFLKYQHEQGYLLAKGRPAMIGGLIPDSRVAPSAFTRKRFLPHHHVARRIAAIDRFGIELYLNRVGIQFVEMDVHVKAVLVRFGLHLHSSEAQLGPVIGKLAAPSEQTAGAHLVVGASPAIGVCQRRVIFAGYTRFCHSI